MKLEHEFTVPAPIDEAWKVLLDVERIAPCMPGATLLTNDGEDFTGTVKVKVGPIQVTYRGQAKFVERDESAHRAVIEASGKEARGSGTAAATVTTALVAEGDQTKVMVETDLNVTGRPAQFGRGVMSEVAAKLIGQFSTCLAHEIAAGSAPTPAADDAAAEPPKAAVATPVAKAAEAKPVASTPEPAAEKVAEPVARATTPSSGPTRVPPVERQPHHASEVIDLVENAGASVARRAAPVVAALLVLFWLIRRRRS